MEDISENRRIVGRFAPSPTGPLHFGSLVAAIASYLLARQHEGRWLLRIEDLDPPRVVPGAADAMLSLLEQLAFRWDGTPVHQSQRGERYQQIMEQLNELGLVYDCSCSRREILASAPHPGEEGPIYPGICRQGPVGQRSQLALRIQAPDSEIEYVDGIFGLQRQNLQQAVGDFVLRRSDGLFAYQLAVVIDDIDAGVNQVVRGADLLSSTPRQIFLYQCLQQPLPKYYHLPLALGDDDEKLSKRHGENAVITVENGARALWVALRFLGQEPPQILFKSSAEELMNWALEYFDATQICSDNRQVDLVDFL